MNDFRRLWQLDPSLEFFNHGSFGATPTCLLQTLREFQDALERDPIEFLAPERSLEPKLDHVRQRLAATVGAHPSDIGWVRNATDGVNAVVRSFPLDPGDEIIITNHGYNACNNAAAYAAAQRGAVVRTARIPFPLIHPDEVVTGIASALNRRTRLVLVDHVTSPSGLVFPLRKIIDVAHSAGARVLVDGAHAPGMLPLDLNELGADYYTANHHKWLCAPKVSGFLWVKPPWQHEVRPTVISHAANRQREDRSRFLCEFDWTGTFDPAPLLSLPSAIDFLNSLLPGGLAELMRSNRELAMRSRDLLASALRIDPPVPDSMIASLVAVPLPPLTTPIAGTERDPLQLRLRQAHGFELPFFTFKDLGCRVLRISLQIYNDLDQVERLADILRRELGLTRQ